MQLLSHSAHLSHLPNKLHGPHHAPGTKLFQLPLASPLPPDPALGAGVELRSCSPRPMALMAAAAPTLCLNFWVVVGKVEVIYVMFFFQTLLREGYN